MLVLQISVIKMPAAEPYSTITTHVMIRGRNGEGRIRMFDHEEPAKDYLQTSDISLTSVEKS